MWSSGYLPVSWWFGDYQSKTKPGTTVSYTYDALGARKMKTVSGTTTRYLTAPLFGMSRVLAELDTAMNFKATYVYGGHQLLKEEPIAADPDGDGLSYPYFSGHRLKIQPLRLRSPLG